MVSDQSPSARVSAVGAESPSLGSFPTARHVEEAQEIPVRARTEAEGVDGAHAPAVRVSASGWATPDASV
jgi:hypothetical protein